MGKIVNQTELAEVHGVSDVTLWTWQKEGMPIRKLNTRGQSHKYDTAETIEWRVARAEKKVRDESPRDMLYREQTKLVQLQIAEKRSELVPMSEVEPMFARMVLAARQRLLLLSKLPDLELSDTQRALVQTEVDKALEELSNYEPIVGADPDSSAALGAAIEDDDRPVGAGETPAERPVCIPGQVQV